MWSWNLSSILFIISIIFFTIFQSFLIKAESVKIIRIITQMTKFGFFVPVPYRTKLISRGNIRISEWYFMVHFRYGIISLKTKLKSSTQWGFSFGTMGTWFLYQYWRISLWKFKGKFIGTLWLHHNNYHAVFFYACTINFTVSFMYNKI